ncbi:AAA family ATPase, partial [Ligaoa zhengdingensis]
MAALFSGLYLTRIELRQPVDAELAQSYVFSLPAVKHLGRLELRQPVTFLVGENGTGKSTLLEAIAVACGFNPEGGTRNFSFSTSDTHSLLHRALIVSKGVKRPKDGFFLRAESFYN